MEPDPQEEIEQLKAELERVKSWNRWFFGRVKFMRECQKDYFTFRTKEHLSKSKAVELEVDKEIKRIDNLVAENNQMKIDFNN